MFDFLDYIRKDVGQRKIPIVAAIVAPTALSPDTISGLAHTTKIFGACPGARRPGLNSPLEKAAA